jgi:hypothetical protein
MESSGAKLDEPVWFAWYFEAAKRGHFAYYGNGELRRQLDELVWFVRYFEAAKRGRFDY